MLNESRHVLEHGKHMKKTIRQNIKEAKEKGTRKKMRKDYRTREKA